MERWKTRAAQIPPTDDAARNRAQARLDDLTKPLGSLGRLEDLIQQLAAATGHVIPRIDRPLALIFAADHGIAEEGVSAYGREVTEEMAVNAAMGNAVSSVLARGAGIPLRVVDVGVRRSVRHPAVVVAKKTEGTQNFTRSAAMTEEELDQALEAGWSEAEKAAKEGMDLLLLGEMGIGNTTAASAMATILLDWPPAQVVGPGTGIDDETRQHKIRLVEEAVRFHHPNRSDPLEILRKVGGFEFAALVGAILSAASEKVPVVLDGMATGVAALLAHRLNPGVESYLIASHRSPEPAHQWILKALHLEPLLDLGMRLGEASGALIAYPLIRESVRVMAETATFTDARVSNPHTNATANLTVSVDRPPSDHGFTPEEIDAVYKVIQARRDIRVFLPDPVPDAVLARILAAGHMGPSVGFMQPWNFILIRDRTLRKALQEMVDHERIVAGEHYPDAKRDYYLRLKVEGLLDAPLTLCVTNDPTRGGPHVLGRNTIPETDLMSTACAIENMWLAARAEGIAVGWVSMYRKEKVRALLNIPAPIDPVALLTMGYTAHFPQIPVLERVGWGRRLDLTDLVFTDRWGERASVPALGVPPS